jgi:hypothetical protein
VLRLLVTANVVPSALILATIIIEAIHSSETSVVTRATRHSSALPVRQIYMIHDDFSVNTV